VIKVNKSIIGPEALAKLLACDDLASLFEENRKDPARLFLEPDFAPLFSELACAKVNLEGPKADASEGNRWLF
jgi:hypothetical protein